MSCLFGEADDFRKIVEKYRGKALAVALGILRNREDAEDACQETFVQVYRNRQSYDFRRSFNTWLFSILYKRCLDLLRRRRRFFMFVNRVKGEVSRVVDRQEENSSDHPNLPQELFKTLNPKERICLILWAVEGFTSEEIGSVLKCSPSTARVHLYKARKKIKPYLEK